MVNVNVDVGKAIVGIGIAVGIVIMAIKADPNGAKEILCRLADAVNGIKVEAPVFTHQ